MEKHSLLAFDLGAESGRAIVGLLAEGRLELQEIHRFANGPIWIRDHLHWDIARLFGELQAGLRIAGTAGLPPPESLGIDTWGVDFALLAPDGSLLGLPLAYRDPHTDGILELLYEVIPPERLYELTGIQFLQFNTLVQLFALRRSNSPLLEWASDLLFIPDALSYLFTGIKRTEATIASTSQLLNPRDGTWQEELFVAFGLRRAMMQKIVPPGTILGGLDRRVAADTGSRSLPVVAVASHDTASAIAAAPAEGDSWVYVSSGTWSLMGIECSSPIISPEAMKANFTNEGGVDGTVRFLRNIMGLWLLQECRRAWSSDRAYSYAELVGMASGAEAFRSLIDPDRPEFLHPADMPEAIRSVCRKTGQPTPASPGEFARCIFESLALKYRFVLDELRQVVKKDFQSIHVIGGGSRNPLLCQFTASAAALPVIAGPAEATAIGNLMMQARALGLVNSLPEMRDIVRSSCRPQCYTPEQSGTWERAYRDFQSIAGLSHQGGEG